MRWMDSAYLSVARRARPFDQGWGDPDLLTQGATDAVPTEPLAPIRPRWGRASTSRRARVRDGTYDAPDPDLPVGARTGRIRELRPASVPRGTVLVMASWGEEGFKGRTRLFGPLTAAGLALWLVEHPFFGTRRREGQTSAMPRRVSDVVLMGRAMVGEARGLLAGLRDDGVERTAVAGFSMGGQMAAMVAATAPWPLAVAALSPPTSPAAVFIDGPLGRTFDLRGLGPDAESRLDRVLRGLDVLALPRPVSTAHAVVAGGRGDRIVTPAEVAAVARHWGIAPRWFGSHGHVGAVVYGGRALRSLVEEVLDGSAPGERAA
ncbi:MAG: alpha/beta hydrolase family protein [Sandaracinaceae bacterium]